MLLYVIEVYSQDDPDCVVMTASFGDYDQAMRQADAYHALGADYDVKVLEVTGNSEHQVGMRPTD